MTAALLPGRGDPPEGQRSAGAAGPELGPAGPARWRPVAPGGRCASHDHLPEGLDGAAPGQRLHGQAQAMSKTTSRSEALLLSAKYAANASDSSDSFVNNVMVVFYPCYPDILDVRCLLLLLEVDAEDGVHGVHLVQAGHLLEHVVQPVLRVQPEPQDVAAGLGAGLDHEGAAELGVPDADRFHLHVRDGHVEVLREVRVPDEAHVGDEEGAQVALVRAQVPHTWDLVVDLLVRKKDQLHITDNRSSQLQITVKF
eukprot:CAMPEP_0194698082 /NCGR_PEP_ID=MMETSP0295-20121207/23844_1 /TAXON_ID=39354 /ORGANISM="Heterosigma akashiwo, Strain CCMP2393" /LENGTH=254 /DNA_ID=CAMNT_0039590945 /DNA_START=518 /DNA_END=1282 /DNA_ORIENTATION=+